MKRKRGRLLCLLCACMLLSGCVGQSAVPTARMTLPPAQFRHQPPENDASQTYEQTVILYLPSPDGTELVAVPETASFSASRHRAGVLCDMLLAHPGTENASSLGDEVALALAGTDAVEVSGKTVTVSLAASALRLNHEQLFILGQALANTLCQFGDVEYVNVLIAGTQPGLNIASTLPAGGYQANMREDLNTLWARASAPLNSGRRSFPVTLYFPAPSGKGILCETRSLSFTAQDLPGMAATLLDAMYARAETLPNVPACPELSAFLREAPAILESGGARRLIFRFREELNAALISAGITRSVMMAALCCTMTTFLPGIEGVEVSIGEERIITLTPSATYVGAGEMIAFSEGLMRRRDFSGFLLAECALYFADQGGALKKIYRPVPFYEAYSARSLVEQLMLGPQPFDSQSGLSAVLPRGLRPADLLGVAYEDQTMLLNFSLNLPALCQGMEESAERALIYALIDTLCELPGVRRAALFIQGEQPETLAGGIYLPGDFLPSADAGAS